MVTTSLSLKILDSIYVCSLVFTGFNRVAVGPGNPGKVAGFFLSFPGDFRNFAISLILICTDISVRISGLTHKTKSDSNIQQ